MKMASLSLSFPLLYLTSYLSLSYLLLATLYILPPTSHLASYLSSYLSPLPAIVTSTHPRHYTPPLCTPSHNLTFLPLLCCLCYSLRQLPIQPAPCRSLLTPEGSAAAAAFTRARLRRESPAMISSQGERRGKCPQTKSSGSNNEKSDEFFGNIVTRTREASRRGCGWSNKREEKKNKSIGKS